ncbi:GNAT family N-acetyltransferase [Cellulomonas sp. 179-A 4D5 NHS]|uniref:GNAT family N-acetyltransferase n=1 Tax=Cellulomonas sp. 179-A 4D5 NHS TaxID=3142378 RepID=UPI0039A25905
MTTAHPSAPAPATAAAAAPPAEHVRLLAGPRGATVDERVVEPLGLLRTTVLDPVADLGTIHAWVTQPGTEFWGLGHLTREELGELYAYVDSLETHHAFVVRLGDEPLALLQTYDPHHDPVGECYPVQPGDVGLHLLIGSRGSAPAPGFTSHLLRYLTDVLLGQPGARRLVVEPDVRNERAVARMVRSGFELGPEIDLPDKRARLAFLTAGAAAAAATPAPR